MSKVFCVYEIQYFMNSEQWVVLDHGMNWKHALILASHYAEHHGEDDIRILSPSGKINQPEPGDW